MSPEMKLAGSFVHWVRYLFVSVYTHKSTHQHIHASTHQRISTSTHQHITTSVHQLISKSIHPQIVTSAHRHIGTSAHRNIGTSIHLLCSIFLSFLSCSTLFAQNYTTEKTASKKSLSAYNAAMIALGRQDLEEGERILQELTSGDPKFIDAWLLLGELYNEEGAYKSGKTALEKVIALNPEYSSKTYFFLAESNWHLDDYDGAIAACEKYLQFKTITVARKEQAERMLANAAFAKNAILHPVPFDPKNLGPTVNSDVSEYLPSISGDEQTLIFTRHIRQGEDFFIAHKKNDQWTPAFNLGPPVNTEFNEGAQTMTPDGNIIYFVVCDKPGGLGSCDIYYAERSGNDWSVPQNVGQPVSTNAWETQPSISADGNTLYFVSTRPGGKGGSDIWVATKDATGKWSNPVNAGDSINTPFDEKSPFIHPDGKTLYFSSKGWPGMGKDDIYFSRKNEDGSWSTPQNLGYPINTKNDENSFIVSLDGHHAYFASDQLKSNHDFDLYEFELYDAARPQAVTYVKGTITDASTEIAVAASIQLIDLENGTTVIVAENDPKSGVYLVSLPAGKNYAMNVSAKGYLFYSENFSLKNYSPDKPYLINVKLKPVAVGNSVVLKNIFFETDSYVLKDESKVELNKLVTMLQQNAALKIQISGFTDNQGTNDYNQKLSENRAKSVYEYLIAKGIPASRISYKGFGATKPVASNDSEEGRAQNRRTEFMVVGM